MNKVWSYLLGLIATRVAIGLIFHQEVWVFIVIYWVTLSVKNWYDFIVEN